MRVGEVTTGDVTGRGVGGKRIDVLTVKVETLCDSA